MGTVEVWGYALAAGVAISGPTGARLKNTGELAALSNRRPLIALVVMLLSAGVSAAAFLYFSWAHLGWRQIAAFFLVILTAGSWVARVDSRAVVWGAFVVSVLTAAASEYLLLFPVGLE